MMTADPRLHFTTPLRQTPFHPRTSALNLLNQWGAWGGYTTVLSYDDTAMEHTAIRNAASVYDLCPMVKYRIEGPDATAYLNRLTVRDAGQTDRRAASTTRSGATTRARCLMTAHCSAMPATATCCAVRNGTCPGWWTAPQALT